MAVALQVALIKLITERRTRERWQLIIPLHTFSASHPLVSPGIVVVWPQVGAPCTEILQAC